MKRFLGIRLRTIGVIAVGLIVIALVVETNIIEDQLDRELPARLSDILGAPVFLDPVEVNLLALKASSSLVVLGERSEKVVSATNVSVYLGWRTLLGSVSLRRVTADHLFVDPDRWPEGDGTPPADFLFLDRWIPDELEVEQLDVDLSGSLYSVHSVEWQRLLSDAVYVTRVV